MSESLVPTVTTPLNSRITAVPVVVPHDTDAVSWRRMLASDVDALWELADAMAKSDHPLWCETREEIAEELGHSWVRLEEDSLVGVDGATGDIVAYGLVILPPDPETQVRSIITGGVRPDWRGRGLGRALLAWEEARALEQFAAIDLVMPGIFMCWAEERAPEHARLFERFGFTRSRWFLGQQRMVADPVAEIAIPPEIRIVPFEDRWSRAALAAKNDAFRDHWGSQPFSVEQWDSMLSIESASPENSFVAVTQDDEVVGLVLTQLTRHDWERQGYSNAYIPTVGVVRAWRRKGIAPALLARVLLALQAQGIERVDLDVDSDNPSGALGLYSGMGFVESNRIVTLTKEF